MIKYLDDLRNRLKQRKAGIVKHLALWNAQSITGDLLDQKIAQVDAADAAIDSAKKALSDSYAAARTVQDALEQFLTKVDNNAVAIHTDDPDSLNDYGIAGRKDNKPKPVPSEKLLVTVEDDIDGFGFILTTTADDNATMYEWYKGVSADASKADAIPSMLLFKTTQKLSFVDDDVVKGQRTWYKVRAVNAAGAGPWSDPANRVQS
ncbi:MAG TPA: hypothetical protein VMU30_08315 [Bacteroidota bacterium]|nr:hypothetical protein [Bacteroidota bacterium]